MPMKTALIALTAAAAATISISAAQAGMNTINLTTPRMPSPPNVTVRPQMIDARIKLHCYYARERNELGVWVTRQALPLRSCRPLRPQLHSSSYGVTSHALCEA